MLEKCCDDEIGVLWPCKLRMVEQVLPCGMINDCVVVSEMHPTFGKWMMARQGDGV